MNTRENERIIFEAFMRIDPYFAGEKIVHWEQPKDPKEFPDVICRCESGRRVGVEFSEWLNEDQIKHAKEMESMQKSILQALGEQGENQTNNIYAVYLIPKPKKSILYKDVKNFRDKLFQFIDEIDLSWPTKRLWQTPQGHKVSNDELVNYPILQKYLNEIHFKPSNLYDVRSSYGHLKKRKWTADQNWIRFLARGGCFSVDEMCLALSDRIKKKITKYGRSGTGFDHLCLIMHYDLAFIYNSPVETPLFKFSDAVRIVKQTIINDPGPFDSILLFIAADEGKVLKIYEETKYSH